MSTRCNTGRPGRHQQLQRRRTGLAFTLGGGEVHLLELTAAFGLFENGVPVESKAIIDSADLGVRIAELRGKQSATPHCAIRNFLKSISPDTAYLITDILADPVARIPAFGAGVGVGFAFPAAVKTGTTTDWRDNWTIGYSTERIVGVWVGNADNKPMLDVSGIDGAGPIWHDLMLAAHPQIPPAFPRPSDIEEVNICAPSGLLPSPTCPRTRNERFIRGTAPTQTDNQFQSIAIDIATGLHATTETPPARIQNRVYWLLGPEYRDWMMGQGISILNGEWQMANGETSVDDNAIRHSPSAIRLTGPIPNTAFRIHPWRAPGRTSAFPWGGYVTDGRAWAELRLVVDGVPLLSATDSARLDGWWTLEPGQHTFLDGGAGCPAAGNCRSDTALVVVEN